MLIPVPDMGWTMQKPGELGIRRTARGSEVCRVQEARRKNEVKIERKATSSKIGIDAMQFTSKQGFLYRASLRVGRNYASRE